VNTYLRALVRFWWLLLIGLAVAVLAGVAVVNTIHVGVPPKLKERTKPSYSVSTQLIVDNPEHPFSQTSVPERKWVPAQFDTKILHDSKTNTDKVVRIKTADGHWTVVQTPTDTKPLIAQANLMPFRIMSDDVAVLRQKKFGPMRGTVTAKTLGAQSTANKFKTGPLPIVQVDANAPTANGAYRLAQGTVQAFQDWLAADQRREHIAKRERVFVEQLRVPTPQDATAHGGSSKSLGLVVGLAAFAAFVVLAFVLDAAFPRIPRPPYEDALTDDEYDDLDDLRDYEGEPTAEGVAPRRRFAFSSARRQRSADDLKAS
jgi:hypothetical protein